MNLLNLKRIVFNQLILAIVFSILLLTSIIMTIVGFCVYNQVVCFIGIVLMFIGGYLAPYVIIKFIKNYNRYKVFLATHKGLSSVTTISAFAKLVREKTVRIIKELISMEIIDNLSFDGDILIHK